MMPLLKLVKKTADGQEYPITDAQGLHIVTYDATCQASQNAVAMAYGILQQGDTVQWKTID